jgi:hypothetical protein
MTQLEQFIKQYQLQANHLYLLELFPLIEMIWVDGDSQAAEVAILQRYAMQRLALLSTINAGLLPISVDETNDFIDRFMNQQPSPQMLTDLRGLCLTRLQEHPDEAYRKAQADEIINYCLDIAAACAGHYPYEFDERIVASEKTLLKELIAALRPVD